MPPCVMRHMSTMLYIFLIALNDTKEEKLRKAVFDQNYSRLKVKTRQKWNFKRKIMWNWGYKMWRKLSIYTFYFHTSPMNCNFESHELWSTKGYLIFTVLELITQLCECFESDFLVSSSYQQFSILRSIRVFSNEASIKS